MQESECLIAYSGAELSVIVELFDEILLIYVQYGTKRRGVQIADFAWRDHNVVASPVAYQNLSMPVVDDSTWRIDGLAQNGIVHRVGLVLIVDDLHVEEPGQQN